MYYLLACYSVLDADIIFFFIWINSLFLSFSSYYILNTLIHLIILFYFLTLGNRPSLSLLWLLWFCCIVWIDFPNQIFAFFIKMKYVVSTKDSATLKRKKSFLINKPLNIFKTLSFHWHCFLITCHCFHVNLHCICIIWHYCFIIGHFILAFCFQKFPTINNIAVLSTPSHFQKF